MSIGNSTDDQVTIRFFTDNPGPWFLHCHIDWHLTALVTHLYVPCLKFSSQRRSSGFAVVFAEDIPDVPSKDIVTRELLLSSQCPHGSPTASYLADWEKLCPQYNSFVNKTNN